MTRARGGGGGQQVTVRWQLWHWAAALPVSLETLSSLIAFKVTVALVGMQPGRDRYCVPHLLHWCGAFLCWGPSAVATCLDKQGVWSLSRQLSSAMQTAHCPPGGASAGL